MSLRSLRSRLERLVKSAPPVPALDWNAMSGEKPPPDPRAEVVPGCGFTWEQAGDPESITDPVGSLVILLPRKPELAGDPDQPDELVPATTEPVFPPGYEPEAEPDDEPQSEGDDDAACD